MELVDITMIIQSLKQGIYLKEPEKAILVEIQLLTANHNDLEILVQDLELRAKIYSEVARQARWLKTNRQAGQQFT